MISLQISPDYVKEVVQAAKTVNDNIAAKGEIGGISFTSGVICKYNWDHIVWGGHLKDFTVDLINQKV